MKKVSDRGAGGGGQKKSKKGNLHWRVERTKGLTLEEIKGKSRCEEKPLSELRDPKIRYLEGRRRKGAPLSIIMGQYLGVHLTPPLRFKAKLAGEDRPRILIRGEGVTHQK